MKKDHVHRGHAPRMVYGAKVIGSGHAVPAQVLSNQDLANMVDTNDEWIQARTGIRERRIAAEHEHSGTLALTAAQRALQDAKIAPNDLDLIIVCTFTPEMPLPSTACLLQHRLGITGKSVPAFDLAAACSGFMYGLATAQAFMQTGQYEHILVVGVETISRQTDYTDRGSCIIFGDGAGAVVLKKSNDPTQGLVYTKMCADGGGWELLQTPGGGSAHPPTPEMLAHKKQYIRMKGREVYKFAVTRMQELIDDAVAAVGITPDEIGMVVPHQVNQRIIDSAVEKLKLPKERVYVNIDRFGNTSAASVPIAFDEARKLGRIKPGDWVIMVAFGAGLTWGSAVIKM